MNEGIKSTIQKLFKNAKKSLGMSKIVRPSNDIFNYTQDYVKRVYGPDYTLSSIGVDDIKDVIYGSAIHDSAYTEEHEFTIEMPKKISESVNEVKRYRPGDKWSKNFNYEGMKHIKTFEDFFNENLNESIYKEYSEAFKKALDDSGILKGLGVEVSIGPMQWAKPGDLSYRDHVGIKKAGVMDELYVIPKGNPDDYELYSDKSYEQGRELKRGDAKDIIKAIKRRLKAFK
jgi:ribosomal protein L7/L12